jgi:capsular polysaccharide biosynthesis protein
VADAEPGARPRKGRRWRGLALALLLILLPVAGAAVGALVASLSPVSYTANAYVFVTIRGTGVDVSAGDISAALARVATSDSVLASGGRAGRLVKAGRENRLAASTSPDAPLVQLSATASTPRAAADLANQLARTVQRQVTTVAGVVDARATLFASASAPSRPSSPSLVVDVLAGAALGVVAASVLFVIRRR